MSSDLDPLLSGLPQGPPGKVPAATTAYTLCKISANNTYDVVGTGDSPSAVIGIFGATRLAGDLSGCPVYSARGYGLPMLSDGAGILAAGDRVTSSGAAAGRIKLATAGGIGTVIQGGPATADTVVKVMFDVADPSGAGSGTVTSVAQTVPSALLAVSGSPITGAGTLALSLPVRVANTLFSGPTEGSDAAPAFRAMVDADLPLQAVTPGAYTNASITVNSRGTLTAAASGSASTLQSGYTASPASAPVVITEDATRKGIRLLGSGQAGSIFEVQTSAAAAALEVDEDATVFLGRAKGVKVLNEVTFGSPIICSATTNGYISLTSDGVGASYGGTGFSAQTAATASLSTAVMTVNDAVELSAIPNFIYPVHHLNLSSGGALSITSNAIAPLRTVNSIGAGLIKTITVPSGAAAGLFVYLLPTGAFTYDNTGNILVAVGGGLAIVDKLMIAAWDGSKWRMSY